MDVGYGGNVVVGLDGSSNAVAAFSWAVGEARARGADIEAVYVWHVPSLAYSAPGYIPPTEQDMDDEGRHLLETALAQSPYHERVGIRLRAPEGIPVDTIVDIASEPKTRMVVVGASGRGGVTGLLLGSVSHALTHRSPKPLAVVVRDWPAGSPEIIKRRIVVGVDGSAGSRAALVWAVADARAREVPLEVVLVSPPPTPVLPPHLPGRAGEATNKQSALEEKLRSIVEEVDTRGVEVQETVLGGQPARVLTERSADAQLLVVGTRGLGRAREAVLGSVSHACTHHPLIPVVIVPAGH